MNRLSNCDTQQTLAACMEKKKSEERLHSPAPSLQVEGEFISLRPLSLFIKFLLETVSKGHRLASLFRAHPPRSEKDEKASQALKLSSALWWFLSKPHSPPPPKKKDRVKENKVRKKPSCALSHSVYMANFRLTDITQRSTSKKKNGRIAEDRLPEAAGGRLCQSLVLAPPPAPPQTPLSLLPHLCCDENGCLPRARRHGRALSGD